MSKEAFNANLDSYKKQFAKKQFAFSELCKARNYMCNRKTTKKQWEQIVKTVGLIYFYAPKDVMPVAKSLLLEMTMREPYMKKFWKENK